MSIVYSDGLGQFQQDNATPHASILVTKWLQEHSSVFRHFHWPPKSPEMNIIEDIRDALLHAVENRSPPPRTPMDSWTVLKDEWCELPPRYLQTLVESMPHRVASLLRAHGGLTRYYEGVPVFLALQSIKINAHEGNLFAHLSERRTNPTWQKSRPLSQFSTTVFTSLSEENLVPDKCLEAWLGGESEL
ncbi:hypothetical protein AVEN_158536-1 [Araneus ventricosus]|uniref:Tc1-like transposase DDE domain-containing protein n=1 Tax=Araneus ventricosus TaxID=182803 RepID=A0A4Y2W059_ARAVE|nr:hypothetical protein AVEN_158536-1 [Araneus ventricosus]